jgi:hypothetical protein
MWKSLKRWPVLVALLAPVAALAVGLVCLPYGNRVTLVNCKRIEQRMSEREVRAILGKPWDDSLLDPEGPTRVLKVPGSWNYSRWWIGDDCEMLVTFDENGRVIAPIFISDPWGRLPSSLPQRVWRRLRARYGW